MKEEFSILCWNYPDARRPMRWFYYWDICCSVCLAIVIVLTFILIGAVNHGIDRREACIEEFDCDSNLYNTDVKKDKEDLEDALPILYISQVLNIIWLAISIAGVVFYLKMVKSVYA